MISRSAWITIGLLLLLGLLRVWPDPFYHQERVSFYLWLAREIEELYTGERS